MTKRATIVGSYGLSLSFFLCCGCFALLLEAAFPDDFPIIVGCVLQQAHRSQYITEMDADLD